MQKEIPPVIKTALDKAAQKYSQSPATTNAGKILRFFVKFIPIDLLIKFFAEKMK